jgi:DnaK suppressor protein
MARQDALLRLHKTLAERRDYLRKKLSDDLATLREMEGDAASDAADAAFDSSSDEMATHLAEFDARELSQIEGALARLKNGTYGLCESCNGKIPVGRLNALPYTAMCIECQREMERYPGWNSHRAAPAWERIVDVDRLNSDPPNIKLSDLEIDVSNR